MIDPALTEALDAFAEASIAAFRAYWEMPSPARDAVGDDREFMVSYVRNSLGEQHLKTLRAAVSTSRSPE